MDFEVKSDKLICSCRTMSVWQNIKFYTNFIKTSNSHEPSFLESVHINNSHWNMSLFIYLFIYFLFPFVLSFFLSFFFLSFFLYVSLSFFFLAFFLSFFLFSLFLSFFLYFFLSFFLYFFFLPFFVFSFFIAFFLLRFNLRSTKRLQTVVRPNWTLSVKHRSFRQIKHRIERGQNI